MAEQQTPTVRKVAWTELLPWLILARCFRIAIQLRLLFCAALGMVLMLTGWVALGWLFSGNEHVRKEFPFGSACPWLMLSDQIPDEPSWLQPGGLLGVGRLGQRLSAGSASEPSATAAPSSVPVERFVRPPADPFLGVWEHLAAPWRWLFASSLPEAGWGTRLTRLAFLLLCGLWALVVWAFLGGVITRAAALELATHDRAKTGRTFRFAWSKWPAYFAAPFFPLVGVLFIAVPVVITGLLLQASGTIWLATLVWPLVLLAGFLMALLLVGLLFGWPLMWANISVEGVDSFDAVGRAYNYVFQRPLHYLFYAIVAVVLGALGWLVVWNFVAAVVSLSYGAAAWSGADVRGMIEGTTSLSPFKAFWVAIIRFLTECLKLLGVGFLGSYFWTASTAIYFLLRRDADSTELNEVCPEEEPAPAEPLPPVSTDAASAPVVQERPPENQAE